MDMTQVAETLFSIGPLGWALVILTFLVAVWQSKKEFSEGNFTSTVILGFAALLLASFMIFGVTMFLAKSQTHGESGKADTKIGVEQRERRR